MVARWQIIDGGYSARQVDRRVHSGALIPVYRGIYRVGHAASPPHAVEAAAILACTPRCDRDRPHVGVLLSDRTAGRIWDWPVPHAGGVQVTVVGAPRRGPAGVAVRRIGDLAASEIRRRDGLPVTSPSLTLLDLAGDRGVEVAAALNEARVQRIVADHELRATLDRHPNRRGAGPLRRLLASERGPTITHSEAERRVLALMKAHGIVPDATQHRVGPYRVDFWFERERLAVEVDGLRYHATPKRFMEDRRRMNDLAQLGVQVAPVTWADLEDPVRTARRLASILTARRRR
ncbi:MAG: DUF559 domain-containing protein [Solirubrobacterales bacterium]